MSMELTYNGFSFDMTATNASSSMEIIYDDAGRMPIKHRYRIQARTLLYSRMIAGNVKTAAEQAQQIRSLLSVPRKNLIIRGLGIGDDLDINNSGDQSATFDVDYGPKPKVINASPLGAENAYELVWECEVCLTPCVSQETTHYQGVSSIVSKVTNRIGRKGYSARTVAGHMELAFTADSSDLVPLNLDAYRGMIVVIKPANCHREQTWDISEDRKRLSFFIIDTEIESPNAWPAGVCNISTRNRLTSRRPWQHSQNEIRCNIELQGNAPRTKAWQIFQAEVALLLDPVAAYIASQSSWFKDPPAYFIDALEIDEDLYSNQYSFVLRWRFIGGLDELLSAGQTFLQLDRTWDEWSASYVGKETRGLSGYRTNIDDDKMLNLCNSGSTGETLLTIGSGGIQPLPPADPLPSLCNALPDPKKSYFGFDSSFQEITDYKTEHHTVLGSVDVTPKEFDNNSVNADLDQFDSSQNDQTFAEGSHQKYFVFKGSTYRVGYPIPRPTLKTIGGQTATPVGKPVFEHKYLGRFFCQPLYVAAWNMTYQVTAKPSTTGEGYLESATPISSNYAPS